MLWLRVCGATRIAWKFSQLKMSRWEIISFIKIEIKNKTKESNKIETNALESKAIKLRAGALNWRMKCWRVVSETIKNAHLLMCTGECVCVFASKQVCVLGTHAHFAPCGMWQVNMPAERILFRLTTLVIVAVSGCRCICIHNNAYATWQCQL